MNKYYLIVPIVMMATFAFFYNGAKKDIAQKLADKQTVIQAQQKKEADEKKRIEEIAQKEAIAKQAQRDADEAEKIRKKEQKYNDDMAKLEAETKGYLAESDRLTKEINQLEIALLNARSQRDKTGSEAFTLSKKVEEAKVSRRSAELEIQRLIEMLRTRTSTSSLAVIPPPPPSKK